MIKTTQRNTGDKGEEIACRFLEKNGYSILSRNYLKKCGEIDIVVRKKGVLHFIEVKTIKDKKKSFYSENEATCDEYRAEDNIHPAKLLRLERTIYIYLSEHHISDLVEWQIDAVIVLLGENDEQNTVQLIQDINL